MTFQRRETLPRLLVLWLMRASLGHSDTASNRCLFQSENLSPGEPHNLTVPCRKPQVAEFQLSRGDPIHVTIPASNCTNIFETSELSLIINSSTPEGTLNLTVICQNLGPLCYSFTVEPPGSNPRYTSDPYSISEICASNNAANDVVSTTNASPSLNPAMQGSPPGNTATATAGNQSNPKGAGANSQEPNSSGMGTAPQGQYSQTVSGVDTSGQGSRPSIAETSVQGQPTQGSGVGSQTQSPPVSTANSSIQPPQGPGTGAQSQTLKGTGQTKAGNAQTSCTCPG